MVTVHSELPGVWLMVGVVPARPTGVPSVKSVSGRAIPATCLITTEVGVWTVPLIRN